MIFYQSRPIEASGICDSALVPGRIFGCGIAGRRGTASDRTSWTSPRATPIFWISFSFFARYRDVGIAALDTIAIGLGHRRNERFVDRNGQIRIFGIGRTARLPAVLTTSAASTASAPASVVLHAGLIWQRRKLKRKCNVSDDCIADVVGCVHFMQFVHRSKRISPFGRCSTS